jgi:predicted lipoprotein with Yx(FWY)xxD motif
MRAARLDTLMRAGRGTSVRVRLGVAAGLVAVVATGTILATGVLAGPSASGPRAGGAPLAGTRSVPPNQAYVAPATQISAWARSGGHSQQNQRPAGTGPTPVPSVTVPAGVPTGVPPSATAPGPALEAATSPLFGSILVDPAGMTVYHPAGGCACDLGYSPLLTHPGQSLVLPVLIKGRIGTVTRSNGALQVTFDGWPLYVFSGDRSQGDTNGDGTHWQVIQVS